MAIVQINRSHTNRDDVQTDAPTSSRPITDGVSAYLHTHHASALQFWTRDGAPPAANLLTLCDVIYALALIGQLEGLAPDAPKRFATLIRSTPLAGALSGAQSQNPPLNPHLTAYVLGTLNLLKSRQHDLYVLALGDADWRFDSLLDRTTLQPRFPRLWAHHSWRSSHWIGGVPSILLSLSHALPNTYANCGGPALNDVLAATDQMLDSDTGFLKLYKSAALHTVFNAAYRLRHDPIAAELGGVVHLHWVNYAIGRRPFVANAALRRAAIDVLPRTPFMENTPYCLDFDILHLLRTTAQSPDQNDLAPRIRRYANDLNSFLTAQLSDDYNLHRLPGALAALHECALMLETRPQGLDVAPIDIIAEAFWL